MTSTLPPDPYAALGLPKDASSATIKTTYRKLALKCHPDKVTDESLKKQKQEEFHAIQQAYELIGDEDKRANYDTEVRMERQRKERAAKGGVDVKTARYETRTAAPAGATYSANTAPRYEERKPAYEERKPSSRPYDDDIPHRYHYDTYEAQPKGYSRSSRPEKESVRTSSKPTSDRTRSDSKKTRDREQRRDRSDKFSYVAEESSSADEKMRYEKEFRRRSDDARKQEDEEAFRRAAAEQRAAAEARRKAETRRSYEDAKEPRRKRSDERDFDREFDRQRKAEDQAHDAVRYIYTQRSSKLEAERPSPSRTSSSRDIPRESYDSRSRRERTEPRRSSARRPEASVRGIQIVDWEDDRRAPPSLKQSTSSPPEIPSQRTTPQRSYTDSSHRRGDTSPTPALRRHETMPHSSSSSRRKEDFVHRPSNLRSSETAMPFSSSPPDHAYPSIPPPSSASSKKYYYPTPGGGVALHAEDVKLVNGHRTVLHEPPRHRTRSPSPLRAPISKPPIGANRPTDNNYTASNPPRATLNRAATLNVAEMERGRAPRLFNEVTPEYRRPENRRQGSYSPGKVSYTKQYSPEDISWSRGSKRDEYSADPRPGLARHATLPIFA